MQSSELRHEFDAAFLTETSDAGVGKIDRAALMRPFLERGLGKSTLHAWVAANLKAGVVAKAAARLDRRAAAARGQGNPGLARDAEVASPNVVTAMAPGVAPGAGPEMAPAMTLELPPSALDGVLSPGREFRVEDRLASLVATIEAVMRHAQHEDGRVRNAKLLLAAAGQMRGCLETANRMIEGMRRVEEVDRFFAALMAETAKLPPGVAEEFVAGLNAVCVQWSAVV